MGPITLAVKCAGARSAGNPHATCDVAGAGNGITETSKRARRRKSWIQPRRFLRITAPALDPTPQVTHVFETRAEKTNEEGLSCRTTGSPETSSDEPIFADPLLEARLAVQILASVGRSRVTSSSLAL